MSPIFSYFNYRTSSPPGTIEPAIPVIRFQVEKSDREAGRFWFGLLHAFRSMFPGVGQNVLASIVDFHHHPPLITLSQLVAELQNKDWQLILENSSLVSSTNWWPGFIEWLQPFKENHSIVFEDDSAELTGIEGEDWIQNITPQLRIALAGSEVWWTGWFAEAFPGENWHEMWAKLRVANYINDFSPKIILPKANFLISLNDHLPDGYKILQTQQIRRMIAWLLAQGEWLEAVRLMLLVKDFEQAGEILQENGNDFLSSNSDPLEVLFWLKEIPGVLMTSKPGLCLLAARAARKNRLDLQVSYYLNALDNNLLSLKRLSHSEAQWLSMELDDDGTTIQNILDQVQQIRIGV